MRRAFWLTIYCVNFYYFVQNAFRPTPVFGLSASLSQGIWFMIVALWTPMVYREIRKAMRGE